MEIVMKLKSINRGDKFQKKSNLSETFIVFKELVVAANLTQDDF